MTSTTQTQIQCSGCGQLFTAEVYDYIDAVESPEAKSQLINGQVHQAQCPHCGTANSVPAPLLYHDPEKELLIAHVPMELNVSNDEQERIVGNLLNKMPKDNFKGYMFNPTRAITLQGLIENVLEAEGITREMLDEQRQRVQKVQQFVEAGSQEALEALISDHDEEIDEQFLQTFAVMAQQVMQSGHQDLAQHIMNVQQIVLQNSSYGQQVMQQQEAQQEVIDEVSQEVRELGENGDREAFLDLAMQYQDDDERLQALVGLARPAFDYEFFQKLTERMEAADDNERQALESLRDSLTNLTAAVDQQQQQAAQEAANVLQSIVNSDDVESAVENNAHLIDDMFMYVLDANIQQANQQQNTELISRLTQVQNKVYEVLQQQMTPELRFINDLLSADESQATVMINERAHEFGPQLVEVMDAVAQSFSEQGNPNLSQRVQQLREVAAGALGV